MYKEADISQAQKVKLLEGMIGAGAGSLVGAGTGAIRAKHISKKKGETKEEAKRRMRNNILGGALIGAGVGSTTSVLANKAARINAKKTVPFYNEANLNKHKENFLNKYKENREKNYAMVNGDDFFDPIGASIRKSEIKMDPMWDPENSNATRGNAVRAAVVRMKNNKSRLENETASEFIDRLRYKKFHQSGTPIVEGVTHKNGRPIVGGHFDNDDFINFVQKSGKKGEFKANQDLINNRLFGGFRSRDTDKAKAYIAESIKGARADAKKDILADVAAVKAQTRAQYQKDKAKNARRMDRAIYHYSNLADKLEGRR